MRRRCMLLYEWRMSEKRMRDEVDLKCGVWCVVCAVVYLGIYE